MTNHPYTARRLVVLLLLAAPPVAAAADLPAVPGHDISVYAIVPPGSAPGIPTVM